MNTTHRTFPWLQFLVTCIVFIAVLGLAYFYQEQIKEIALVPLLYLLWVVDITGKMFGQRCVWWFALMITLILTSAFSRRTEKPIKDLDRTVYSRAPALGRIHFWRRRVRVRSDAINAVSYRRSEMYRLVIQAMAYRENSNNQEIEKQLRSGQLRVPAEVSYVLGLDRDPIEQRRTIDPIDFIKLRFRWIIERFVASKFTPDPRIEKVAEYLENIMEVDNDPRNQ